MIIRKAVKEDIDAVAEIYDKIHTAEEKGELTIGWERGVYPERETALAALERDDLFVMEDSGELLGAGVINQIQVDVYAEGNWKCPASPSEVMVLHTLVIAPGQAGRGYGTQFVKYYEEYALENGCRSLRLDTNERNASARSLYRALGYEEIGIVPCVFNGLEGVSLVLIEKNL